MIEPVVYIRLRGVEDYSLGKKSSAAFIKAFRHVANLRNEATPNSYRIQRHQKRTGTFLAKFTKHNILYSAQS